MRFTTTTVRVVTRTAPIPTATVPVCRLTADGIAGEVHLRACLYYSLEDACWNVHRFVYRLSGGLVRENNVVNLRLISDGDVVHRFDSPRDVVNDGRWYVHEHATLLPRAALTYARFEGVLELPGLLNLLRPPRAAPQPPAPAPAPAPAQSVRPIVGPRLVPDPGDRIFTVVGDRQAADLR